MSHLIFFFGWEAKTTYSKDRMINLNDFLREAKTPQVYIYESCNLGKLEWVI